MSLSNLYFRGCFNQPSQEQVDAIESIPNGNVEGTVVDKSCFREDLNTCGISIQDLFNTYSIYSAQKGLYKNWGDIKFPWKILTTTPNLLISQTNDKWEISTYREVTSYEEGDKVLYIENDGYEVSLYEAITDIPSLPGIFDHYKWNKKCSVKTVKPVGLPTLEELYSRYKEYALEVYNSEWGNIEIGWSQPTSALWKNAQSKRNNFYLNGDITLVEQECGDIVCTYIAIRDIPVNDFVIEEYVGKKFSQSIYLSKEDKDLGVLTPVWEKLYCVQTQRNKCLEYQRKKEPELGYDLLEIGSRGHFVEVPVPYRLRPPESTLNSKAETKEPPKVLTQEEIDSLPEPKE